MYSKAVPESLKQLEKALLERPRIREYLEQRDYAQRK
jgi:hypothetical protein